ncbi:MAG: ORF6N domain-containing protein [Candidatus Omnitrophica bacterium]|nr:ORF6N domain-containing protein [Candidatus Omnitrophota bacterium]
MPNIISVEVISGKILFIRGKKVMLDKDLSLLYRAKPIALRQQVKRNWERFPDDFMFQLTEGEVKNMVSHFVIPSKQSLGGYLPYAFTEQGVAMLSSVLHSRRAVLVNIQIMRAFIQLKRMLLTNAGLKHKIEKMEKKYDKKFAIVFQALKQLLEPPPVKPKPPIGFRN